MEAVYGRVRLPAIKRDRRGTGNLLTRGRFSVLTGASRQRWSQWSRLSHSSEDKTSPMKDSCAICCGVTLRSQRMVSNRANGRLGNLAAWSRVDVGHRYNGEILAAQ